MSPEVSVTFMIVGTLIFFGAFVYYLNRDTKR